MPDGAGSRAPLPLVLLEGSAFLPSNTMRLDLRAATAKPLLGEWVNSGRSCQLAVFTSIPLAFKLPSGKISRLRSGTRIVRSGCIAQVVQVSSLYPSAGRVANAKLTFSFLVKGIQRCEFVEEVPEATQVEAAVSGGPSAPMVSIRPYDLEAETSASFLEAERRLRRASLQFFLRRPHLRSADVQNLLDDPSAPISAIADVVAQACEDDQFLVEKLVVLGCTTVSSLVTHVLAMLERVPAISSPLGDGATRGGPARLLPPLSRGARGQLPGGVDDDELRDLKDQWRQLELPREVNVVVERELSRMERMPPQSPECTVSRTYVETLLGFPWSTPSSIVLRLNDVGAALDAEHIGLQDVKRRILEYVAGMILTQHKQPSLPTILCLVGPPGVGKTSLGKVIAKALQRPFQRISLGGVYDEAELRGHRRTYVGALPGVIAQAIKRAGALNPVILLDEVDKVGVFNNNGGRHSGGGGGAVQAALLEILDPDQNSSFVDHYLALPIDLSRAIFIATANSLESVSLPLQDRMEVIQLSGYTVAEKVSIAQKHLVQREIGGSGLTSTSSSVTFQSDALEELILCYTREAGVRQLQREVGSICRYVAMALVEGGKDRMDVIVDRAFVAAVLGAPKYASDSALTEAPPAGVVTGMAWTPSGGELLFVEAVSITAHLPASTSLPGAMGTQGITGSVGRVMEESCQTALNWIRAHSHQVLAALSEVDETIDANAFLARALHGDVRVHLPAGAVSKDGPSAGCALLCALISAFSGLPVSPSLAMSGEITLRGAVLPVGGIKEKMLAATRGSVKTVILPAGNRRDFEKLQSDGLSLRAEFVDSAAQLVRAVWTRRKGQHLFNDHSSAPHALPQVRRLVRSQL